MIPTQTNDLFLKNYLNVMEIVLQQPYVNNKL